MVLFDVSSQNDVAERKVLKSEILDDRVISRSIGKQQDAAMLKPKIIGADSKNNQPPVLGIAVKHKTRDNLFVIKKLAVVNKVYRAKCPACGKNLVLMPHVAGKFIKNICSCGAEIIYKAKSETPSVPVSSEPSAMSPAVPPPVPIANVGVAKPPTSQASGVLKTVPIKLPGKQMGTVPLNDPQGALCWKTGTLLRRTKVCSLDKGRNTIGREDKKDKSDIMIGGDDEMSRQSVEINVVEKSGLPDFVYELRVLKATNPIFINSIPIDMRRVVLLNHGDIIRMGKTDITFIKRQNTKQ